MELKKPKILVVDDKPENLFAIETVLKDLDVELITAMNGNDALKETLHHKFVLALLDIQMPGMDGYELANFLREEEQTTKIPIIFISAVFTDPSYIYKGYEHGAFSFITKPFQPEILINKVKFFVEKYKHEAELELANKELEIKNEQLTAAFKELDLFTFSVSHDLRAPLRYIEGYIRILIEDYRKKLDKEGIKLLDIISLSVSNMNKLIDALLEFSRLGKQEVRKSQVDMNELVDYVIKELMINYKGKEIDFQIEDLPGANGDPVLLKQVFANLISNAIKFSSKVPDPIICIKGFEKENKNIYMVGDNGIGFSMKYVDKLFGIFQRLHSESEFEGTGVGLANVKRIVIRHGGRVWADAEENRGARFYFSLPV